MNVYFTDHAVKRMEHQAFKKSWLLEQLEHIPPFETDIRWRNGKGHILVLKRDDSNIVVITVIALNRQPIKVYL